jgi:catechol 2,3-dioxygenase-like lactoylglutathione lyase family enzyme
MHLNHITVTAADVEVSAGFYGRLGLTQIVAAYPDYARFLAPEGDMTLSLQRAESPPATPSTTSIHFEVDDVDATVAALEGLGFRFLSDPVDEPYLWREAVLHDPDGNRIFIYHAGVNRLDPPWRLPDSGKQAG